METLSTRKRKRPEKKVRYCVNRHSFREKFDSQSFDNMDLNIDTKRAALKASTFVVSLVSRIGGKMLFLCSGAIIECEGVNGAYISTILTSASLLRSSPEINVVPDDIKVNVYLSDGESFEGQVFACDFHYNIAAIKIKSEEALPTAILRNLDDSTSIDPTGKDKGLGSEYFQLRPHSNLFNLCPGDDVVAIGRYFRKPYDLMVAPGKFSLDSCEFDCRELFRSNCKISKCGIGGPLVNHSGEVIGVSFYDKECTPFLPINIVSKCLEHFKKYGKFCRLWLGMEMTNLYAASVGMLERIIRKFPNISKGVLVKETIFINMEIALLLSSHDYHTLFKVIEGSPAEHAGIFSGDVIVQCGDKFVRSFLEFHEVVCDKVGESVEVVVIRKSGARLNLTMVVDDTGPEEFNRWPLPKAIMRCNIGLHGKFR